MVYRVLGEFKSDDDDEKICIRYLFVCRRRAFLQLKKKFKFRFLNHKFTGEKNTTIEMNAKNAHYVQSSICKKFPKQVSVTSLKLKYDQTKKQSSVDHTIFMFK